MLVDECCFSSTETVVYWGRETRTSTSTFTQLDVMLLVSKHGRGQWGERGYVGKRRGRLYTYRYTVTTTMIPALREISSYWDNQ